MQLLIGNETYSDESLLSDKFVFEYIPSRGTFRISSGAGIYSKYLTTSGFSTNPGTNIVQKSYLSSYYKNFEWYLTKTDSLGLNVKNVVQIYGTSEYGYNLTIQREGVYVIETVSHNGSNVDTVLTLKSTSNQVLSSNDNNGGSVFSKITYNFTQKGDYWVRVKGANTSQYGPISIQLRPEKELFFNTIWDPVLQLDNVTELNSSIATWQSMGYYANVLANMDQSSIYEQTLSGKMKMNNDYYIFWGHGTSGSVWFYNGPNSNDNQNLTAMELPLDLSSQIASVWLTCHGASLADFDGYFTSMARESVIRGAEYSVGWRGEISSGGVWLSNYIEALANGFTELAAVYQANEATKYDIWPLWLTAWMTNNDLWNPVVYRKNSQNQLVYSIANVLNPIEYLDDGGTAEQESLFQTNALSSVTQGDYDSNSFIFEIPGINVELLKVGETITNIPVTDDYLVEKAAQIIELLASNDTRKSLSDDVNIVKFAFENENRIELYGVSNLNGNNSYYRLSDNSQISLTDFMRIANSTLTFHRVEN